MRIKPITTPESKDCYDELARRLSAANLSIQMGVSLHYAYKTWAKDTKPGPYWLALAEEVFRANGNPGFKGGEFGRN